MKVEQTQRGFDIVRSDSTTEGEEKTLVQQSSAIGDYEDSMDKPGSSSLWIGGWHHLNREEIAELRDLLTRWLETGRLSGGTE